MEHILSEVNAFIKEHLASDIELVLNECNNGQISIVSKDLKPRLVMVKKTNSAQFVKEWKEITDNNEIKRLICLTKLLNFIKFSQPYNWAEMFNFDESLVFPKEKREEIIKELETKRLYYNELYVNSIQAMIRSYPGKKRYLENAWSAMTATQYGLYKTFDFSKFDIPTYSEMKGHCIRFISPYEEIVVLLPYNDDEDNIIRDLPAFDVDGVFTKTTQLLSSKMKLIYILEQTEAYVANVKKEFLANPELSLTKVELNRLFKNEALFQRNAYALDSNTTLVVKDVEAGIEGFKPLVKKEMDRIVNEHLEAESQKVSKYKQLMTSESAYPIVHVVHESPKKGITTYVDILKGTSSQKIKSNDYDKLKSYGALATYTKSEIIDKIDELRKNRVIEIKSFKASFGRYEGLVLSEDAQSVFNQINQKEAIKPVVSNGTFARIDEFIEKIKEASSDLERKSLIKRLDGINLEKGTDVHKVIKFIVESRNTYRTNEDLLFNILGKQIPTKYKPLILLNANLTKNQAQKSLMKLSECLAGTK